MGRPKKSDTDAQTQTTTATTQAAEATQSSETAAPVDQVNEQAAEGKHGRERAYELFQRDSNGLLKNVKHIFKDDGSVDWKAMIPDEYIVVNDEYFTKRQIEIPSTTTGLDDKQKLVLLGGIKEIAKIRGILCVEKRVCESSNERAVVSCKITFAPNYETNNQPFVYEEVANATLNNTNSFSQIFLETIASNRAFVRAVRNALRIDIVGTDELSNINTGGGNGETTSESEPWHALRDAAKNAVTQKFPEGFKTFDEFKQVLIAKGTEGAENWNDWKDIPPSTIFKLITLLKKTTAANSK